jgi:hypothetical protein
LFENLKACCEEKQLRAHRRLNMDEIGLPTVPHKLLKVINPKDKRLVSRAVTAETGQIHQSVASAPVGSILHQPCSLHV